MKWLFTLSLLLSMTAAQAQVSQEEVEQMLQQMVKENVISASEAEKAKIKMKSMNGDQWSALNKQAAAAAANRAPASVDPANPIREVKNNDLDKAQFKQIEDEIKKIMPEQR